MLDTRGTIVAMGYTQRVSLFTILGQQVSTRIMVSSFVLPLILFKSDPCSSRISLVSTAMSDISHTLGLPELFNPVASRSK